MNRFFLTLIMVTSLWGTVENTQAQTTSNCIPKPPVRVSHKQMFEDFDQFVQIVKTYNAQWEIRAAHTGYDIVAEYEKRRNKIRRIHNYWQFIGFMKDNLYYLLDCHAAMREVYYDIPVPIYAPGQSFYDSSHIADIYNGYLQYEQQQLSKSSRNRTPVYYESVNSQYIDGQYYMAAYFSFKNPKTKDSICFSNAKIISYDDRNIDDYVREQIGFWPPTSVRWDFKYNKYYTDALFLSPCKKIEIEKESGEIIEFIPNDYPVKIQQNVFKDVRDNLEDFINNYWKNKVPHQVLFFPEQRILYIYTESMYSHNEYNLPDTIKQVGKDKNISKVVIDVRGNQGGGDEFWMDILSSIVKDSILVKDELAINANEEVLSFFYTEYPDEITKKFAIREIPFLGEKKMLVNTGFDYIIPDSNSLNFEGPIYIFQDGNTFSSGHSFSSLAKQINQLVSMGESTGNMVGFGFNPWGWQLNNSKFTFKFEPAIDLSGATKWEDTFQCIPEIIINPTLREKNEYDTYRWGMDTESFLLKKDYLFRKVMEIE